MKPNTKNLRPNEKARFTEAVARRIDLKIRQEDVAPLMGYGNRASVSAIENGRRAVTRQKFNAYVSAVNHLAEKLQASANAFIHASPNPIPQSNRVTEPVSAETLAKIAVCARMVRKSRIPLLVIAMEMGVVDRPITDGMVSHFLRGHFLTPERAAALIAAVEKLCPAPQIAITMPAPDEAPSPVEQPAPPTAIDYSRTPLVELVSIAGRCNEELQRHRSAFVAMFGDNADAAWNAAIAAASTPTPRHP